MDILIPAIKKKIQSSIIDSIRRKEYHHASREISDVLVAFYASIPEKNRVSYGIVYTIKVLSEYLYKQLTRTGGPVYEVAGTIYEESDDTKLKCVALGIMSFYGLGDLKKAPPLKNSTKSVLCLIRLPPILN